MITNYFATIPKAGLLNRQLWLTTLFLFGLAYAGESQTNKMSSAIQLVPVSVPKMAATDNNIQLIPVPTVNPFAKAKPDDVPKVLALDAIVNGRAQPDPQTTPAEVTCRASVPVMSNLTMNSVNINWNAVPNAVSYKFEARLAGTTAWAISSNISTTSVYFYNLTSGLSYEFRVTTNCTGVSTPSVVMGFTTLCPTPVVTVSRISTDTVFVTWASALGVNSYQFELRVAGTTAWNLLATAIQTTAVNLRGLTPGVAYELRITANCTSNCSVPSTIVPFTTNCPTASIPVVSRISVDTAFVTWASVVGATAYQFELRVAGTQTWNVLATALTTTAVNLRGLAPNTTYELRIVAKCASNVGLPSNGVVFRTLTPPCNPTSAPSVSGIGLTNATVSWLCVPYAVNYKVEYKVNSATTWTVLPNTTALTTNLTGLTHSTTYNVRLTTICAIGSSNASTISTFTTLIPPCNPTSIAPVTAITLTNATVSWTAVPYAISYKVEYKENTATVWTTLLNTTALTTNLTGLNYTTLYNVRVTTVCASNSSIASTIVNFTTLTPPCNPTVTPTISAITLTSAAVSWTAVPYAVSYKVEFKANASTVWTVCPNTTALTTMLTGLTHSTVYNVRVTTVCAIGSSNASAISTFTTLIPPCNAASIAPVTAITLTGATLSWTAVPYAISYKVEYKENTATVWTALPNTTALTANLTGLNYSTMYNVRVTTVCASGLSNASTISTFTTLIPPCNPTSIAPVTAITLMGATLSWTAVPYAISYKVEYKANTATVWAALPNTTATALTANLTGLAHSTTYNVRVTTICASGSSNASTISTFTTLIPPCNPTVMTPVTGITLTGATVSWAVVPYAVSYKVEYKENTATVWTALPNTTALTANLTGLTYSTTYNVRVTTVCASGLSNPSTIVNVTTLTPPCNPTSTPNISAITLTGATISWTTVPYAMSYKVEWKANSSTVWTALPNTTALTANLTGLNYSTMYNVRVTTVCASGLSNPSTIVNFTTVTPLCNPPSTPTITGITLTGATVSWTAVPYAVSYKVEFKENTVTTWTVLPNTTVLTTVLSGLNYSTTYNVRVTTVCAAGSSSASTITNVTTLTPPCNPTTAPTVSAIGLTNATISWTAVPYAVSYKVEYKVSTVTTWAVLPNTTVLTTVLNGLNYSTTYNVRMTTVCAAGSSNVSTVTTFTTQNPPCNATIQPAVTSITLSNITFNITGAAISWAVVPYAIHYNVEYKIATATIWNHLASTTNNSVNLMGLNLPFRTDYIIRVVTVCASGEGTPSPTTNLGTLSGVCSVYALTITPTATAITNNSAIIGWTPVPYVMSYRVEYKANTATTWNTLFVPASFATITGLMEGTSYNVRIITICQLGETASVIANFQTGTSGCNDCGGGDGGWDPDDDGDDSGDDGGDGGSDGGDGGSGGGDGGSGGGERISMGDRGTTSKPIAQKVVKQGNLAVVKVTPQIAKPIVNEVTIYPNPSTGVFKLECKDKLTNLLVYNAYGQLILNPRPNEEQYQLDLTDYAAGMYLVKIGEKIYKIVKK